jgi:predicted enzyme related to lactoylglutathione lyase
MPKIDKHAPGTFCWVELGTTDQSSAKNFYSSVFGWNATDMPMGPNEYYTLFKLNGGDAAAAYTMRPEERAAVPPHWNLYVAVDDADASAKRAGELGGKIVAPPFDVMTFGRMAVIMDPTGAAFCIWQAKDTTGTTVAGESGTLCWADLSTPEPAAAKPFYEGLFGWKIGPDAKYPPEYMVISKGEQLIGGIPPVAFRHPGAPPHWMLFFLTGDVDGVAAKTKSLGGAVRLEPMSMGSTRFAVLADRQGAGFSVIQH